ncbi:MAG: universal stress protein [Deltaproteobacteria bacterium]|nr:universal stress protein [Deltaproteobacteria bacterium]MBW2215959.1 universal stress protein [Deltaproteobacteria bacterium]
MSRKSIYQNMLLPLDGSKEAEKRVDEAISLMKLTKGELILFHVVDVVPLWGHGIEEDYQFRKDRFEKYVGEIKSRVESEGVNVKVVTTAGKPADEICKYATREEVDIVLVSPHGAGGVFGWAVGSVAARVTRHSPKPVLVIRRQNGNLMTAIGVKNTRLDPVDISVTSAT